MTKSTRTSLDVELRDGTKMRLHVNTIDKITRPINRTAFTPLLLDQIPRGELADPTLTTDAVADVDVLVGNDYYVCLLRPERKLYLGRGLYGVNTDLGWVLSRQTPSKLGNHTHTTTALLSRELLISNTLSITGASKQLASVTTRT